MTTDLNWLRPHFEKLMEEWWETIKVAYQLSATIITQEVVQQALARFTTGRGTGPYVFDEVQLAALRQAQLTYQIAHGVVLTDIEQIMRLAGIRPEDVVRRGGVSGDVRVEFLDREYRAYNRADMAQAIIADWSNRRMAVAEFNDCDDYAWRFKAHMAEWFNCRSIGFVVDTSAGHAYNIIVYADGTADLFDPQTDKVVKLDDPIRFPTPPGTSGRYSLTKGLILI